MLFHFPSRHKVITCTRKVLSFVLTKHHAWKPLWKHCFLHYDGSFSMTLISSSDKVDLTALFTQRQAPMPDSEVVSWIYHCILLHASCYHHVTSIVLCDPLGTTRGRVERGFRWHGMFCVRRKEIHQTTWGGNRYIWGLYNILLYELFLWEIICKALWCSNPRVFWPYCNSIIKKFLKLSIVIIITRQERSINTTVMFYFKVISTVALVTYFCVDILFLLRCLETKKMKKMIMKNRKKIFNVLFTSGRYLTLNLFSCRGKDLWSFVLF